jgi:glycosyltransferase involved in cell wall biosynthesis
MLFIILEKFAAKFTDLIILLTNLEKKDFLDLDIIPEEKIRVVRSGIEFNDLPAKDEGTKNALRNELNLAGDETLIGMVSRLEAVKGVQYFVDAAITVAWAFPKAKFLIAGDGSLKKELEAKVKLANLGNRILFLGWREDNLRVISCLDILVQPSLNEAVGRVILEAQALGACVVASRVGGIPEIVTDQKTGILVEPQNAEKLAQAVMTLIKDAKLQKTIRENAEKWVRENFSAENMVAKINEIYRS